MFFESDRRISTAGNLVDADVYEPGEDVPPPERAGGGAHGRHHHHGG